MDGSVFKHHPLMADRMAHYIKLFAPSKQVSGDRESPLLLTALCQVTLTLAEDGSGRGAAFLAAIVSQ